MGFTFCNAVTAHSRDELSQEGRPHFLSSADHYYGKSRSPPLARLCPDGPAAGRIEDLAYSPPARSPTNSTVGIPRLVCGKRHCSREHAVTRMVPCARPSAPPRRCRRRRSAVWGVWGQLSSTRLSRSFYSLRRNLHRLSLPACPPGACVYS